MAERHRDKLGNSRGLRDRVGPFRDRAHQGHLIDTALQLQQFVVEQRAASANQEHRNRVHVGVGHAGHRVGHARSRGDHRHAGTSGRARPSVGHMRRRLLVAGVDDAEVMSEAGIEDRVQMAAVQGKDLAHAFALQGPDHHLTAVYLCHRLVSQFIVGTILRHSSRTCKRKRLFCVAPASVPVLFRGGRMSGAVPGLLTSVR